MKVKKSTLRRLLSYLKEYKLRTAFVMVCILVSAIASVSASLFIQTLIDGYILPLLLEATPNFSGLLFAILQMACLYMVGVVATYLYNRCMVVIAQQVLKDIRDEMFAHMQTLPISYFDQHSHGDVMSHFTNDTDTLRQMLSQSIPQIFASIATIVTVFCAMLSVSVWLTLFVVVFMVIIIKVINKITQSSGTYFVKQQASMGDVNGYIEEMIHGVKVVKVFRHEQQAIATFKEKNEKLYEHAYEANKFSNILGPIMNNLGYLLYVLIAIFGGSMAIMGVQNLNLTGISILTLGSIASFLQLSRSFIQPMSQVSQQMSAIIMALAGATRIFELMDEESECDEGYVTLVNVIEQDGEMVETVKRSNQWAWKHPHHDGTLTYHKVEGDIRFFDVDFAYVPEKMVLENITLYAQPGQKVALVGATGAGKTTITNLINRFYDLADGKVRYDGININKIKKDDLRRSLGIVLQDVQLFTGTIMDNIRYGRLDASDEECVAAAKLANADGFIHMLPHGYQTVISGEGEGLSQGQRQLLSIARVAVADPPVMILDEATSSIDTRTEKIVQDGMDALMHGRTVFVIAHRLSTVQNADVIMVMDHGRIIERGTHEKLIEEKGKYYQLYTGAFELE